MGNEDRVFRRPKSDPNEDAAHTLRIGVLIFVLLWFLLPALIP